MQPIVGVISDGCKSKWGRRRPFLLGGSIVVVFSLLAIGWTRELTWFFTRQEQGDTVREDIERKKIFIDGCVSIV
jgi:solute carrier family 45 protein 1/2/4